MERLNEALSRVIPDTTTAPGYHVQTDELTVLFGGRIWPREALEAHWMEIDLLLKCERYCPGCQDINNCPMLPPGWQTIYDTEGSERYIGPVFRVRPCKHFRQIEQAKKERQLFAPRTAQQAFETFQVTLDNAAALNRCLDYTRNFSQFTDRGLLLIGSYGTGKTHLAVSIAKELLRRGYEVGFVKVPMLLDEIRASYDGDGARAPVFTQVQKRFVVFDDLGAERPNEWVQEQLFKIIEHRSENYLPTVITSNLNIPALEERIGRRTVDRILGMCDAVTVQGESWRRRRPAPAPPQPAKGKKKGG